MFPMMMPFPGMGMPESSSSEPESVPAAAPSAPPGPAAAPLAVPGAPVPPTVTAEFSRSQTFVRSLGHKDLSFLVEDLEEKMDSSWTADLSKTGLLALIYTFSRVKPNSRLCDLRFLA